jgi:hypothetical protein
MGIVKGVQTEADLPQVAEAAGAGGRVPNALHSGHDQADEYADYPDH